MQDQKDKIKIAGRITFKASDDIEKEVIRQVFKALEPDNLPDTCTLYDLENATITFSADKIGTLLATIDDYLMNARIAYEVCRERR